jgi:hypothetical protein
MTQPEALRLAVLGSFRGGLTLGEVQEAEDELNRLIAQRDALLEALKKLDNFFETYRPEGHPVSDPHELVRAAIKKAEENT